MAASAQPAQHQDVQPGREYKMNPAPDYEPRYPGSGRLRGRVALITGGDSGIGRAVSVLFAREGAKVGIVYLEEDRDAEDTKALVEEEGSEALLLRGAVGDKAFCRAAVTEVVRHFGHLDILVNNAAEQHVRPDIAAIEEIELEETFRTNFYGYFFMVQAALRHLKEGAAIINTASITAYQGHEQLLDYSTTKGAIVTLTRALSQRLADRGIRVNAVAPGPIWTPLIPASFPPEKVAKFGTNTPMGRAGQPNEVAPAFLFLACDDSSYFTGQTIHPNGGAFVAT